MQKMPICKSGLLGAVVEKKRDELDGQGSQRLLGVAFHVARNHKQASHNQGRHGHGGGVCVYVSCCDVVLFLCKWNLCESFVQ